MARLKGIILTAFVLTAMTTAAQNMTDYHADMQAVDEYRPAPGQFINTMPYYDEGDDGAAMVRKCTETLCPTDAADRGTVCLGGYGGYITFHFDHPIANVAGQRDFAVFGNSILSMMFPDLLGGSSEPGIVMVSQDLNGNGKPDDTWYELSGSADTDSTANLSADMDWERRLIYGYEVTYTRGETLTAIPWTDNQGHSGTIARMDQFHQQEYWPQWMTEPTLTFRGTRLPRNAWYINRGQYQQQWVLFFLRYGYADNRPNADTEDCGMDISWAVDPLTRQPVTLDHIDFVRVYTAMNQSAGNLGETSTEIRGARDLHLEASIAAMQQGSGVTDAATIGHSTPTLLYRIGPVSIVRMADGRVRKEIRDKR